MKLVTGFLSVVGMKVMFVLKHPLQTLSTAVLYGGCSGDVKCLYIYLVTWNVYYISLVLLMSRATRVMGPVSCGTLFSRGQHVVVAASQTRQREVTIFIIHVLTVTAGLSSIPSGLVPWLGSVRLHPYRFFKENTPYMTSSCL